MLILSLVRNYLPAHKQIVDGGWDIGQAAEKAYDLQNKVVGCVGTGRIGTLVLERLKVIVDVHSAVQSSVPMHYKHTIAIVLPSYG